MTNLHIILPWGSVMPLDTLKIISYAGIGTMAIGMIGKTYFLIMTLCERDNVPQRLTDAITVVINDDNVPPTLTDAITVVINDDNVPPTLTLEQLSWIDDLTEKTDENRFGMVEESQKKSSKDATEKENKPKNRYDNILPYDDKRVKIPEDYEGSNYINASHVRIGNHHLIASQGPMKSTCFDHWIMIWYENVVVISMVTGFVEKNKEKCFEYLPLIDRAGCLRVIESFPISVESLELDSGDEINLREIVDSGELILLNNILCVRNDENVGYIRVTKVTSTSEQKYLLLPGGVALNLDGNYGITTKYGKLTSVTKDKFKIEITKENEVLVTNIENNATTKVFFVNEEGKGFGGFNKKFPTLLPDWEFIKIPVSKMIFERNLADGAIERFTIECTEVEEKFSGIKRIFTQRTLKVTYETINVTQEPLYGNLTQLTAPSVQDTRTIQHLQFNAWPDHDAPNNIEFKQYFIKFLELMKEMKNAPGNRGVVLRILVHCSAGVGRTGTVLTFLELLTKLYAKEFEQKTLVDIINKLREQRMSLVQTKKQFDFIRDNFKELAKDDDIMALIKALDEGNAASSSESNTLI